MDLLLVWMCQYYAHLYWICLSFLIIYFTGDVNCIILLLDMSMMVTLDLSVGEGIENSVAGGRTGADPAYSWPTPGDNGIRGSYHSPGN